MKLIVPGSRLSPPAISLNATQLIHTTEVRLCVPQLIVQVGEKMTIAFNLHDQVLQFNRSLKRQKTWGSLVIVKRSSNLTKVAYISTQLHPDSTEHQLRFTTRLFEPDIYKLWLQFERNGE